MPEPVPGIRFGAAAVAAGAAAAGLVAAQGSFARDDLRLAVPLALSGLVLAAAAGLLLPRPGGPFPARRLRGSEVAFLAALLLLSAALRFPRLAEMPPGGFFDEAENDRVAQRILAGERPVFVAGVSQIPAFPFYPLAAAVAVAGPSVATARAVSALLGTITVGLVYLLARRLFAPPVAAAVGLVAAGMRWHLNFSRVAFLGVWVPLLSVAAVLLLLRALESSRRGWWVALGATVAVGLQTYYAFELFPLVLIVLLLLLSAVPGSPAAGARPRVLRGAFLAAATGLLVLAPLLAWGALHPRDFFQRSSDVAIWNPEHGLDVKRALVENARSHLLMFGYRGDANARHNIPEAPLLTPVESVLLMLGTGVALGRGLSIRGAGLLAWVAVMLLPGVLTIEAPQAYRTIGAIPAVLLLAGEGLDLLWRLSCGAAGALRPRLLPIALPALALSLAAWNATDYFCLQVTDPGAWKAFDGDAKALGLYLSGERAGRDLFVDSILDSFPVLRFTLHSNAPLPPLVLSDHFPAPPVPPPPRPALYILEGFREDLLPLFREAFPCATARRHVDPSGRTMFSSVAVPADCRQPAEAIRGGGFRSEYFEGARFSGPPAVSRVEPAVFAHFHRDEDGLRHPFGVDWTTFLSVPVGGETTFELLASSPARLVVDGKPLLALSALNVLEPVPATVTLSAGEHTLSLRYVEKSYESTVRLWWTPPGGRRAVPPLARLRAPTPDESERLRRELPPLAP